MEVTLALVRETGVANSVRMKRSRLVIGRKDDCEIRIPVGSVSREHAEITLQGDTLVVKDLGSSNGTYVDGQRVQEGTLVAGSILTIGPATFVVQIDGQPATIDPAAALKRGTAAVATPPKPAPQPPRPAAPAKPQTSKVGGPTPGQAASPAPAKPAAKKKKDPEDSGFDFDLDNDDSSISDVDFSDLLKDEDDEQPKL